MGLHMALTRYTPVLGMVPGRRPEPQQKGRTGLPHSGDTMDEHGRIDSAELSKQRVKQRLKYQENTLPCLTQTGESFS